METQQMEMSASFFSMDIVIKEMIASFCILQIQLLGLGLADPTKILVPPLAPAGPLYHHQRTNPAM
jgi:hypothetical protein